MSENSNVEEPDASEPNADWLDEILQRQDQHPEQHSTYNEPPEPKVFGGLSGPGGGGFNGAYPGGGEIYSAYLPVDSRDSDNTAGASRVLAMMAHVGALTVSLLANFYAPLISLIQLQFFELFGGGQLATLIAGVVLLTLPFTIPLVVLIIGRRSAFIKYHAAEALNFQITVFLAMVAITIVTFILAAIVGATAGGAAVGIVALLGIGLIVVSIFVTVCTILGAYRAATGELYEYPISLPIVSRRVK